MKESTNWRESGISLEEKTERYKRMRKAENARRRAAGLRMRFAETRGRSERI